MGGDGRFEQFLSPGDALDMIRVRVRGDDHLARGQVKVHATDDVDDLFDGFKIADVDEEELAAAVDQVHIDAEASPGLIVHLDDMREQILPLEHDAVRSGAMKMPRRPGYS